MMETRVRSLGWEDTLEKEMATHASILAWKIPWTEKPGRLQVTRVTHNLATKKKKVEHGALGFEQPEALES